MKNKQAFALVDLIVAITVLITLFAFFPTYAPTFPSASMFLIVAILLQMVPAFWGGSSQNIANRAALFTISAVYAAAQGVASLAAIFIFPLRPIWSYVSGIILLLLYAGAMLTVGTLTAYEEKRSLAEQGKVMFIDQLVCLLEECKQAAAGTEITDLLTQLVETARYSDIMSPDVTADVELQMLQMADTLKTLLSGRKWNDSKEVCAKLKSLLQERNLKCKLYKRSGS